MKINVLHLYYDLLNLYGETGNIIVLSKHLTDQGVKLSLEKKTVGDDISFSDYDFVYIGSGTEKNQIVALNDLIRYKDELKTALDNGLVMLATGNSFEIFGEFIQDTDQSVIEALKIFNFYSKREKERTTSDIIYTADFLDNKIIGFVNKMSNTFNIDNYLFKVEFGVGGGKEKDFEGIRENNFFGTYVIGPVLVRNPHFMKYLTELICKRKNPEFVLNEIKYENEDKAFEVTLKELTARKDKK